MGLLILHKLHCPIIKRPDQRRHCAVIRATCWGNVPAINPVAPSLSKGSTFFSSVKKEGHGFDKLSPNGLGECPAHRQ